MPCGGRQYHDQTALLEGYHMGKTESRSDKNLEIYPHARHLGGEGNLKWEGARLKPGARGEGNLKNKGGHNIIMLPKILVLGLGSYRFTKYGRFATKSLLPTDFTKCPVGVSICFRISQPVW